MKVAIITNTTYETIIPLAKSLSAYTKVELFTILSSRGSGKSILFEKNNLWETEKPSLLIDLQKKKYINVLFENYINNKYKIHAIYLYSLFYLHPRNFIVYLQFIRFIKKNNYDIIHVNIETPILILLKIFCSPKKIFITIHDPLPHSGENNFQKKILRKYLNRKNGFAYIFHSHFSLEQFKKNYPKAKKDPQKVIRFGPHEFLLKYKNISLKPKKGSVLFFGRLSPYKGIEYLIEGFKLANNELKYLKLIIAGNGKLNVQTSDISVSDNILIYNYYIPNKFLTELIQKSEIVICPYTDATQSGVIESALTFGKPVIATDVGAFGEVIKHGFNGYLIKAKSSLEVKAALIEIFGNRPILKKIQKNASNYFLQNENQWEQIGKITLEYYRIVLNK